jgi:hypothetical protein
MMNNQPFETKDSGKRQDFETGARRDVQDDKPRYDLVSIIALKRIAELLGRGAAKYGDRNWEKGIPLDRYYASMFRHMIQWAEGDTSEDHLAAVCFNAMGIMHTEQLILWGDLPLELATAGSLDTARIEVERTKSMGETTERE